MLAPGQGSGFPIRHSLSKSHFFRLYFQKAPALKQDELMRRHF